MKLKKMLTAVLAAGMVASTIGAELPMTQLNTVLAAEDNGTFNSVATTRSYKDVANNNPCITQKYSADPGVMVYNGRVYVYATNDGYLDPNTRYTSENTYAQVNQINVMSSSDMVNWTDHGSINVAGSNGVAKWATNSWTPAATHKTINGKEKFFLYFANGRFGNARGTLTGVNQLSDVNPYIANQAANMAWQGGINVYGLGQTSVAYNRGDFTGVSNVAFGNTGANSVVIKAGSKNGARIKICTGSQNGTAIGYVDIPATGDNFKFTTVTANIDRTTGTKDLFFVASNDVVIESWQFVNGSQNNQNQNNNQNNNNQNQSNNQNNNNQNQNTNTGYAQMQDGWYYIKNVNAQKYLQVANNSGEKGNNVEISTGNGSLGQKWYLTNKGNNVITLKNGLGCLLDVTNGRNENGINIEIWAENNKNPQNFMLKNAGNNQYGIVTQISNGARGLDAANKGTNDGTNVIQYDFYGGTNQLWTLESTSVNNNNNNQNNNQNQPVVDNKNVVMKDGWYYIKNLNAQKYLQVANNQGANGINVEIGAGSGVKGQKWYVTNTSDGYVTLTNGQGFMLDIQYGKADDGTNIQTYSANGADAQKFKISALGNNQYSILTKVSQDSKALDVYNFGTNDGANVCQWTYYKNANQIWYFEPCN